MGGRRSGDSDKMCTSEEVEEINRHTDQVGEMLQEEDKQISGQVSTLEDRFSDKVEAVKEEFKEEVAAVKKDFKEDINILFEGLADIRKSVSKSTGIQLTAMVFLFGLLFNWMWDNEQARDAQQLENTSVLSTTTAVQRQLADDVEDIADMMKKELDEDHEAHLNNHIKYDHSEID